MNKAAAPTQFRWDDPLLLDEQLTDEERLVRDSTRAYCQEKLLPRIVDANRHERFDREILNEMGALGLLGATLGRLRLCRREPRLLRTHCARGRARRLRLPFRDERPVEPRHVPDPRLRNRDAATEIPAAACDRRARRLLRPDRAESRLRPGRACKPARAKSPTGMCCTARKCGSPTRRSPIVFVVWAKDDDGDIRGFLLEKGMKGLSAPKIEGKFSLRASVTGEIVMDDVFVPDENLLPNVKGLKGPFGCLNKARYGIAWGALGAAEACWHAARQYALDRQQFGRPLAANQLIQWKLANMQTEIALGLEAVLRVGRLTDAGRASAEMVSLIKRNSCGKALEIARMARDMHGGNGIADEFHVIRHVMNLEAVNTYEGTHDIHALILGRAQTGIPAFS